MKTAPIALFTYNRPQHTRETIAALRNNELAGDSDLTIFSDAPKNDEARAAVDELRRYLPTVDGFRSVTIVEREENLGLARSIISGVTRLVEEHGRIIVLEDDLITSPFFLRYMNDALERYQDEPRVMQVSGHMFPVDLDIHEDALFLPFTTSWGWGTWARAWKLFDGNASGYEKLKNDQKLKYDFNLKNNRQYFRMLEKHLNEEISSWAILWYLSVFSENGLVLFPKISMIRNEGFDGSGIHCKIDNNDKNNIYNNPINIFPEKTRTSSETEKVIDSLKRKKYSKEKIFGKLKKILK